MVTHNRELARQAHRAIRLKDGKMEIPKQSCEGTEKDPDGGT